VNATGVHLSEALWDSFLPPLFGAVVNVQDACIVFRLFFCETV